MEASGVYLLSIIRDSGFGVWDSGWDSGAGEVRVWRADAVVIDRRSGYSTRIQHSREERFNGRTDGLPSEARSRFARAKDGTGTGIRTPVPWLRTTCPD